MGFGIVVDGAGGELWGFSDVLEVLLVGFWRWNIFAVEIFKGRIRLK